MVWDHDVAGSNPVIPTKREWVKTKKVYLFSFLLVRFGLRYMLRISNPVCYSSGVHDELNAICASRMHSYQIRHSRLIQSYRPTVFFLSLKIDRKSLVYKGFFAFVVHFGMCGAYMLYLGSLKKQESTTPRQGVVPFYR